MKNIKDNIGKKNIIDMSEFERKKNKMSSFFLDANYLPMTLKQIKNILAVNQEEIYLFESVVNELENEGLVFIDDSKRYVLSSASGIYRCMYFQKGKKFGIAIVESETDSFEIYIPIENINSAMNKDIVLVKIIYDIVGKTDKRKVGKVIKVIKRNTNKIFGRYLKSQNFGFVESIDFKTSDIFISKKYSLNAKNNDAVEVEILKYAEGKNKAEGKIIRVIGSDKTQNIEAKLLYESYALNHKERFNSDIEEELKYISDEVDKKDLVGRVDKTAESIYTIDSADAMDLDDAICVKKIAGGKYILSVHIADVSNYVKAGSAIDKEAIQRATSVYIPSKVIPMLPKKLSNGICSLNANVLRLALSIDMIIDENGNVEENKIYKSVINVKKKMTYEKVYKVIEKNDPEVLEEYKEYINDIMIMKELALKLNKRRLEMGSINFDIPETKVILDKEGNVVDVKPYEISIANNIIEEFMLIANMQIAEKFFFLEAPFIYRVHEKPDEEKLRTLNELLSNYGLNIKGLKNVHPKTLADILNSFEDEESKSLVSKFMLRTLKLAKYSNESLGHFGLAAMYYCHFTSPIRRYPDLFIHRVISDYLTHNFVLEDNRLNKYFKQAEKYALISSEQEKEATLIERSFDDLYKAMYMKDKIGDVFDSRISSITAFGMFVKLENTIEGLVPITLMDDDYYIFDESKIRLTGERKKKVFKIGDKISVRLVKADVKTRQIDFEIVKTNNAQMNNSDKKNISRFDKKKKR